MTKAGRHYKITELCQIVGVEDRFVFELIKKELIQPVAREEFDDEDLTRIRLISDLMKNMDVNENAVPIILHLIDQIHCLHLKLHDEISSQNRD